MKYHFTVFGQDCIWLETCRTYTPEYYSVQYCHCSKLDCSEKLECDSGGDVEIEKGGAKDQDYVDELPDVYGPSMTASDTGNNWFNTAFGLCLEPKERSMCQSFLMQKIVSSIATLGSFGN